VRDDRLYLTHILEGVGKIQTYCVGGRESFPANPMELRAEGLEAIGAALPRLVEALHDADVADRPVLHQGGVCELPLGRIGMERPTRRGWFLIFARTDYPAVPGLLRMEGVLELSDSRRAARDAGEPEILLSVDLDTDGVLVIETDFGVLRARLAPDCVLEYRDTGPPGKRTALTDLG
jgi:hypothetical protein